MTVWFVPLSCLAAIWPDAAAVRLELCAHVHSLDYGHGWEAGSRETAITTRPEAPLFCPVPDQTDSSGISKNIELHTLYLWISMYKTYQDRICAETSRPDTQGGPVSGKDRWERNANPVGGSMRQVLLVTVVLVVALAAQAYARVVVVRGQVGYGTLDSGINSANPYCCIFLTKSKLARMIFKTCKEGDECEIAGNIDKNGVILSVHSIRKIDINCEPSAEIIKGAACWAVSRDKSYCGISDERTSVHVISFNQNKENNIISWCVKFVVEYKDNLWSEVVSRKYGCVKIIKNQNPGFSFYSCGSVQR